MPNYLNKPLSSNFEQTYVSQFVPLPLAQFARANERDQAQQDAQVQQAESVSDQLWKVNGTTKDDQAYASDLRNKYDEAATALTSKNLTQKENQDAVKDLIKGTSRDPSLQLIMSNSAIAAEHAKLKDEHQKAGTYSPYNDMFDSSFADYAKSGGYKSGKSLDSTIYKYEDTRDSREKLVNDMKASGQDIIGKFGETYYNNGFEGISKSQAYKTAKSSLGEYMQTTAGAQDAREFSYMQRNNPKNKELQKMDSADYIFSKILTAANERVYSKTSSGLAAAKNADTKKKEDKAKEAGLYDNMPTQETPSSMFNGYKVEFDDKGEIKGSGRPWTQVWKESTGVADFFHKAINDTRPNDEESIRHINVQAGAKLNNMTPKAYADIYNNTSHMVVNHVLTGKPLADAKNTLFNGSAGIWSAANVRDTKTGESNMNMLDALRKSGKDVPDPNKNPEEFKKFLKDNVSVTGLANPNEFSQKPVIFTFQGSEFAMDMTNGGKHLPYVGGENAPENIRARQLSNLDKLMKGQLVPGVDNGKQGVFFRNLNKLDRKTGKPTIDFKAQ